MIFVKSTSNSRLISQEQLGQIVLTVKEDIKSGYLTNIILSIVFVIIALLVFQFKGKSSWILAGGILLPLIATLIVLLVNYNQQYFTTPTTTFSDILKQHFSLLILTGLSIAINVMLYYYENSSVLWIGGIAVILLLISYYAIPRFFFQDNNNTNGTAGVPSSTSSTSTN